MCDKIGRICHINNEFVFSTLWPYEPQIQKTYLLRSAPNCASAQSDLWVFDVRMKRLSILVCQKGASWRFCSDCVNAQTHLNLRWVHMSRGTFFGVAALSWRKLSFFLCRLFPEDDNNKKRKKKRQMEVWHMNNPCGHMTCTHRRLNVDATSWRYIDVEATLY